MDQTPPPAPGKKSGLHPLAWLGLGCGGLIVVAVVVVSLLFVFAKNKFGEFTENLAKNPEKAAAEMIVKFNPDLEMVSDNEAAGEMTIRVKSSGEEVTVGYEDLAEGRFTVKNSDGTVTSIGNADVSQIPSWVPRYPHITKQASVYHQEGPKGIQGVWVFSTTDTPEQVSEYFDNEISWSTAEGSTSTSANSQQTSRASFKGNGREVEITTASLSDGEPTRVTIGYTGAAP